jgi:hypothetical protein
MRGPLFRSISRHGKVRAGRLSGIDVARVVKKLAERAGLEAAKYASHSLRLDTLPVPQLQERPSDPS